MLLYVISVDNETGKYCAFDRDDHARRVSAYTREAAIAGWVEQYGKGIIDVVYVDHEMPPDPPRQPDPVQAGDLTWGEALQAMHQGKHVRRPDWPEGEAVTIDPAHLPHIVFVTAEGRGRWDLKVAKIHTGAKDWRIVEWPPQQDSAEKAANN